MVIGVTHVLLALFGVAVGIVFGAVPGMTATMALAVFLPLTYAFDMAESLYLLLGLYVGGISGGLIPAILINIPGTPSSLTTTFDGYPMAKRGEGERALKMGITVSLIGGLISLVFLAVLTPQLALLARQFSAVEKFLIIFFAMTVIAALSKGALAKGIFAGFAGVLIKLMGYMSTNNKPRLLIPGTESVLRSGFQLLPVLIGLFAIATLFKEAETGMKYSKSDMVETSKDAPKFKVSQLRGQGVNIIRSSLLGLFMGILPGVGGSAASLMAYSQAKTWSKHPEKFGSGIDDGLVASETSNNALTGGALIPLLSLGIPGDSTTAVLVGAFMLQGLQVGPLFITENPEIWTSILVALLVCNLLMFLVMYYPIKWIAKIVQIPKGRLYPVILMMCVVGAFCCRSGVMFDVWAMLIFGVLAYFMGKFKFPTAPFLIGFILGGDLEQYFIEALQGSRGSFEPFFTRPGAIIIWVCIIASMAYVVYDNVKDHKKAKAAK